MHLPFKASSLCCCDMSPGLQCRFQVGILILNAALRAEHMKFKLCHRAKRKVKVLALLGLLTLAVSSRRFNAA